MRLQLRELVDGLCLFHLIRKGTGNYHDARETALAWQAVILAVCSLGMASVAGLRGSNVVGEVWGSYP